MSLSTMLLTMKESSAQSLTNKLESLSQQAKLNLPGSICSLLVLGLMLFASHVSGQAKKAYQNEFEMSMREGAEAPRSSSTNKVV